MKFVEFTCVNYEARQQNTFFTILVNPLAVRSIEPAIRPERSTHPAALIIRYVDGTADWVYDITYEEAKSKITDAIYDH
jgi:hypothetical protein